MIIPRDYQEDAYNALLRYFYEHSTGNPLVGMPTGVGKSIVIAMWIHRILQQWPRTRMLALTHVKELIVQNSEKLRELWPSAPMGVFSAGLKSRDYSLPIIFGGVASVYENEHLFGYRDFILIDEAHLLSPDNATMYQQVINRLRAINPNIRIIGLTATPWRAGQGKLTEDGLFTEFAINMTTYEAWNWFIAEGYILPLIPRPTVARIAVENVRTTGGEFAQKQLEAEAEKITEMALEESIYYGQNRHSWLTFAAGLDNAEHCADYLSGRGIESVAVHSKRDSKKNDDAIKAFKAGELRSIVNYGKLTTGFDHAPIDFIPMLRATRSANLWVQMGGRGTRPVYAPGFDLSTCAGRLAAIDASQKQNTLLLDFGRNADRLGPINDPRMPRKKGDGDGDMPVKICGECEIYNHAAVRYCGGFAIDDPRYRAANGCGHEFERKINYTEKASPTPLMRQNAEPEEPDIQWFDVLFTHYGLHQKRDAESKPSVRVTYHSLIKRFTEYVPLESPNAKHLAHNWWRRRHSGDPPANCDELLRRQHELPNPKKIRVWTNKQPYPEILAYEF